MKKYCLDTSGLSNPLENMPEDIHSTLWQRIAGIIMAGGFAVTKEIYDELFHLPGSIGDCIRSNSNLMLLEIGDDAWDWNAYIRHINRMKDDHGAFISEYNGGRKRTIGLNDLSIVALGKTMALPVISMESFNRDPSSKSRRIPDVCFLEGIQHLTFSEFLRVERVRL
jgi:Domain of unknown function (DUF4411)